MYQKLTERFPNALVVIPPSNDAVYHQKNYPQRNRNLQEIKTFSRMSWQHVLEYGKRNKSELGVCGSVIML